MMQRPFLGVESSNTLVFDGLQAVCWFIEMSGSITAPRIINVSPGQLYSFVFTQDAAGGHTIHWPGNVTNGGPLDPAPNSTTTVHFICDMDGELYANIAPTGK